MKRILISSAVALATLLGSTAITYAVFTSYLTVGSTGADVTALQTWLISNGFDIPAITSGAATKGYFGQQTKAAVVKYQASVSLPSTGFVGPLTIAKLNGAPAIAAMTQFVCPVGYTCTINPGAVVNPVTPVAPGPLVMDGTDGSLTISLSSFASNSTVKKGETKDMVAVKLQATAGPVSVTRLDARFDKRPWLYFSTVTLKDSNGVLIATKNISSASDATEVTVGSDYLVRFDGINAVITPGTDRTLVVSGTVLSTTDKLTSDVNTIVTVQNSGIRTINGNGYTDSIGLGAGFTSGTTGRTVTLSSSGSTANIVAKLSTNTPPTQFVLISSSGEVAGKVLGKFDFKSENRSSTINTLTFTLKNNNTNKATALASFATLIKRLYISDGVKTVQVDSVATSSVFSNLTFDLPQDTWKTLTLTADIADADDVSSLTTPISASSTITVNTTNIVGIDSNFTTVTASGGNAVISRDMIFATSSAIISDMTATAATVDNGTTKRKQATIAFSYKLTNNGSGDLYVAKNPDTALATSSTVTIAASSTLTQALTTTSPTNTQDTSTAYIIPANTARSFYYTGLLDNTNTAGASHSTSITKVYFDDDTVGLQKFGIDFGIEALATPPVSIGI